MGELADMAGVAALPIAMAGVMADKGVNNRVRVRDGENRREVAAAFVFAGGWGTRNCRGLGGVHPKQWS